MATFIKRLKCYQISNAPKNILVTGGAGFIGSHLARGLVESGHRVSVIDNFSTGRKENLAGVDGRINLVEGDIRDPEVIGPLLGEVEAVFHQAALPSVPRSFADPVETNAVNTGGTLALLEAARKAGVSLFVFASSSSIYGDADAEAKSEDLSPDPLSPYAASKLAGEQFCRLYWKLYGLPTISLRYFNVFGPGQDPESQYSAVLPLFITAVLEDRSPVIYGDGSQSRDFSYVENVVRANLACLNAPEAAYGEVCNVACGERIDLLGVLEVLREISGKPVEPVFADRRPGDVLHSRADISRAAGLLGYSPSVRFPEGLRRTYDYFASRYNRDSQ